MSITSDQIKTDWEPGDAITVTMDTDGGDDGAGGDGGSGDGDGGDGDGGADGDGGGA